MLLVVPLETVITQYCHLTDFLLKNIDYSYLRTFLYIMFAVLQNYYNLSKLTNFFKTLEEYDIKYNN